MCGVAAVVGLLPLAEREALCSAMTAALSHRGPDGHGLWSTPIGLHGPQELHGPGLSLGHRRLAIVDQTAGGAQPMRRGALALSWNGEVYNHRALRAQWQAAGEAFATDSDTEVLLASIQHLGLVRALQAVEGPLALVLWDAAEQTLSLARDRFGKKPLYYLRRRELLLVASEPKAIVVGARRLGLSLSVDRGTLARYLADAEQESGDATFFADIRRVAPAELLQFRLSRPALPLPSPTRTYYYTLRPDPLAPRQRGEFLDAFRQRLTTALQLRLDCEVPVGALLSGGMDSSALVCLAHRLGVPLPTFSAIHRPGDPCDERAFIDAVLTATARPATLPLPHWRVVPEDHLTRDAFLRFVHEQDEPTGGASVFAQACVFRLVQQHGLKVAISGQGADEALTGYGGSRPWLYAELLRRGRLPQLRHELAHSQLPGSQLVHALAQSGWLALRHALPLELSRGLLDLKWQRAFRQAPFFALHSLGVPALVAGGPLGEERDEQSLLHGYLYRLLTGSSLRAILRTEDRSSMAAGIESRAPFLDHRLVELCLAARPEWLVHDGRTKALLRDSLGDVLPPAIAARRDKIGFGAPELRYLQGPLLPLWELVCADSQLGRAGLLDVRGLAAAVASPGASPATSHAAWKALSVELWLRSFSLSL
ncbi:MAG: asparagine synthase (glutamine-hydrolyzing) [Myxococcales bacterium]|nr:asparagine synthase (glutamine-hydrolyzing) [Myxococcales bacterium]